VLDLTVTEVAHGGWCVARITGAGPDGSPQDHGKVVFVRHALPGERVRARVTSSTARFARADAVEILAPAAGRVEPPCRYARPDGCGGCDLQHAAPATQRALKAQVVAQQLSRIAGIEREVEVEELPGPSLGWRSRVGFAVTAGGVAGLRKHRSREVVAIDDCLIAHPLVREAAVPAQRWPGAQAVEVAVSPGSGERSVTVKGRGRIAQPGRRTLTQHAAGRTWRVSNGVFWQVHPAAADTLAAAVLAALDPQPADIALDLYCGAGLFAGVLAAAVGPSGLVTGVESDVAAVRDARKNLAAYPQVRIHRGDATDVLEQRGLAGAALAVLDPPRTGATPRLIELLAGPGGPLRRIAYVSCDPATLARDIAAFAGQGWQLTALRAFDAFPMTHHIECLATLTRR
jgi:tRNA/tmRNA/rRNA uracil-C5-methylase (TrmA/RlmC/RlmD family)